MTGAMSRLARAWNSFWFECRAHARMRVFRSTLGALLFLYYALRTQDVSFFYTDSGILPREVLRDVMDLRFRYSLLNAWGSDAVVWTAHFAELGALAALTLGWRPRLAAALALVLHISFLHRNMAAAYGMDLIATFFLLYLCGADFAPGSGLIGSHVGSVAFRLSQIQVCVIYAYSGMGKLQGSHWWRGEAVWDVLANAQLARWDFSWASSFPMAVVAATYVTLAWEVYFPVLVWIRPIRYWVLALGVMIHAGIGLTMNIPFFGGIMAVSYLLFLDEADALRIERRAKSLFRRAKKSSSPAADGRQEQCPG
jgi:lipid-A-disaccharide synthase-like uncharacterized protein